MRSAILFSVVSTLAAIGAQAQCNSTGTFTGCQGDAPALTNNPVGPTYVAAFPDKGAGGVKGSITATAGPGGVGVQFYVSLRDFPTSGGPFPYHLHVLPVNSSGCSSTLAHLDPYIRGEQPPCDSSAPQTCQVGDLSGKHGKVPEGVDPFTASYIDPYASLTPGVGSFFGNRSAVVHFSNTTRINCASFALVSSTNSSSPSATTSKPAQFTGSAASMTVSLLSIFGGVTAALFL